ncbi:MAG TPA: hypothetical protein VMT28_02045 [Terriglobales bacterium]|jgi:hypothetical protein|nr:hypothetical protein [Terriglobales bacterium]
MVVLHSADVLYLPISKTWIISRAARRLYLVCALAAFALFGVIFAVRYAMTLSGVASLEASPGAALLARMFLWPGILGTGLLTIAMWYFWFSFDNSGWLQKALWFVPLYLFIPVGPALYYFLVYRRNPEVSRC